MFYESNTRKVSDRSAQETSHHVSDKNFDSSKTQQAIFLNLCGHGAPFAKRNGHIHQTDDSWNGIS